MLVSHIKRVLTMPGGKQFISVIVGFGLATLFRKSCEGQTCVVRVAPPITDVIGKLFNWEDGCVTYKKIDVPCTPDAITATHP